MGVRACRRLKEISLQKMVVVRNQLTGISSEIQTV